MLLQILAYIVFVGLALGLSVPMGKYLAKVYLGQRNLLTPVMRPVEKLVYRICGIDEGQEMTLKQYLITMLGFEFIGILFVIFIMEMQGVLPLNPQHVGPLSWDLALNTAVSYVTNTNWTAYVGERDLSYLSQIFGVLVQDIISPAVGMSVVVTLARCFSRKNSPTIGNFWVDMTRTILYAWVPLSLILVFPLISQGVIQNLNPYIMAHTLEGREQIIPGGLVGAITTFKLFIEDGCAWSAVSSAHPFENPTGLSVYLEMAYIFLVPSSIVFMIGHLTGSRKISIALFSTMVILFLLSMPLPFTGEFAGNPLLQQAGVQGGLNLEGKEMRYSLFEHVIWIVSAMAPANGSTIAAQDSVMPLTILQILLNLGIGAPIFGCIGSGSLAMIHYFIVSMFLAGLMTGRTPELIGKKLDLHETILATVGFLTSTFASLGCAAIVISVPAGLALLGNNGPHGLTDILYAFISTSINNGSYLGSLAVNTPIINLMTILPMLLGKFACLVVSLLIAGSIAKKGQIAVSSASLPVASPLFILTVIFVIILLSALTYFPALTLGPILENVLISAGKTF